MSAQAGSSNAAPVWVKKMVPGYWYRISGDTPDLGLAPGAPGTRYLADTDPARDSALNPALTFTERCRRLLGRRWAAPWQGRSGFSAITEAWNSAVYASRFGAHGAMVCFGGGHDDYFGSSVHSFDLGDRQWRRLTDGYVTTRADAYGAGAVYADTIYPDGSPLPPHTYDYMQYDAQGNDLILLKGQVELGPRVRASPTPHLFNFDTLRWRRGATHPQAVLNSGGFTTWDPGRRLLWGHSGDAGGGNAFVAFCPDGLNADGSVGHWAVDLPGKLPGVADHNAMQMTADGKRIVVAVHARDGLEAVDPQAPQRDLVALPSRGPRPQLHPYAALTCSGLTGQLFYYSAHDRATVHAITLDDTAHWRAVSNPRSLDPVTDALNATRSQANPAHTFGRFRIASFADLDLAILVRHIDSPVYAMRVPE